MQCSVITNDERTRAAESAGEDDAREEADVAEAMDVVSEDEVIELSSDEEGGAGARVTYWRGVIDLTEDDSEKSMCVASV